MRRVVAQRATERTVNPMGTRHNVPENTHHITDVLNDPRAVLTSGHALTEAHLDLLVDTEPGLTLLLSCRRLSDRQAHTAARADPVAGARHLPAHLQEWFSAEQTRDHTLRDQVQAGQQAEADLVAALDLDDGSDLTKVVVDVLSLSAYGIDDETFSLLLTKYPHLTVEYALRRINDDQFHDQAVADYLSTQADGDKESAQSQVMEPVNAVDLLQQVRPLLTDSQIATLLHTHPDHVLRLIPTALTPAHVNQLLTSRPDLLLIHCPGELDDVQLSIATELAPVTALTSCAWLLTESTLDMAARSSPLTALRHAHEFLSRTTAAKAHRAVAGWLATGLHWPDHGGTLRSMRLTDAQFHAAVTASPAMTAADDMGRLNDGQVWAAVHAAPGIMLRSGAALMNPTHLRFAVSAAPDVALAVASQWLDDSYIAHAANVMPHVALTYARPRLNDRQIHWCQTAVLAQNGEGSGDGGQSWSLPSGAGRNRWNQGTENGSYGR